MRGTKHVRQAQASACGPCCFLHTARYRIRPGFRRPRVLIITPIQRPPPSQCRRKLTPRVLLLLQNPRASRLSACSRPLHFPVTFLSLCSGKRRSLNPPFVYRKPGRSAAHPGTSEHLIAPLSPLPGRLTRDARLPLVRVSMLRRVARHCSQEECAATFSLCLPARPANLSLPSASQPSHTSSPRDA